MDKDVSVKKIVEDMRDSRRYTVQSQVGKGGGGGSLPRSLIPSTYQLQ